MWFLIALGKKAPLQGFHEHLVGSVDIKHLRGWAELFKMLSNTAFILFLVIFTCNFVLSLMPLAFLDVYEVINVPCSGLPVDYRIKENSSHNRLILVFWYIQSCPGVQTICCSGRLPGTLQTAKIC